MDFPNSIDECIERMLKTEPNIKIGSKLILGGCKCLCGTSELEVVEITKTYNKQGKIFYFALHGKDIKYDCTSLNGNIFILTMYFTCQKPIFSIIHQGRCCECYNKYCHEDCRDCKIIWCVGDHRPHCNKPPSHKQWKVSFGKCKHSNEFKLYFLSEEAK